MEQKITGYTGPDVHFVDFAGHRLIVMRAGDGDRLAMGSTTGNLWIGERRGTRWNLAAPHLPPVYAVAWGTK